MKVLDGSEVSLTAEEVACIIRIIELGKQVCENLEAFKHMDQPEYVEVQLQKTLDRAEELGLTRDDLIVVVGSLMQDASEAGDDATETE